jgi:tetratricopeptide (TPR) repeat protein
MQRLTGDHKAAIQDLNAALALFRDLGDRLGDARTLHNLGSVRRMTSDYSAAIQDLETGLALFRDLGDRLGEADALSFLGYVRLTIGGDPAPGSCP